jgi:hypothetical protein
MLWDAPRDRQRVQQSLPHAVDFVSRHVAIWMQVRQHDAAVDADAVPLHSVSPVPSPLKSLHASTLHQTHTRPLHGGNQDELALLPVLAQPPVQLEREHEQRQLGRGGRVLAVNP